MKRFKSTLLFISLVLVGCGGDSTSPPISTKPIADFAIRDYSLSVNSGTEIIPIGEKEPRDLVYEFDGNDISIWHHKIYVHTSGTETTVTAIAPDGSEDEFIVTSPLDVYQSSVSAETNEGWLEPVTYQEPSEVRDMPRGVDVSTAAAIYRAGGQFYNEDGYAEDLFRILARNGVNYVRLRLWNDPYNYTENGKVPYGGGVADLEHVLEMAYLADQAGLDIYLDFHYSDFWADPGKQVIPKAWANIETSVEMAAAIAEYTEETLLAFKDEGFTPKIVSLGNETTPGMLVHLPGPTNEEMTGEPYYTSQISSAPSNISGRFGTQNYYDYIEAAHYAVKKVDPNIKTMVHTERNIIGRQNEIINHYNFLQEIPFDIIGLSAYPYWQGTPANFKEGLQVISEAFPDKLITLAETSYGFTFAGHQYASSQFNPDMRRDDYAVSVQGQADILYDYFEAIHSIPNGYGIFYWEAAFIPVKGVGWADTTTKSSWANQALFSYDGHVLDSLRVYKIWEK